MIEAQKKVLGGPVITMSNETAIAMGRQIWEDAYQEYKARRPQLIVETLKMFELETFEKVVLAMPLVADYVDSCLLQFRDWIDKTFPE